MTRFNGAAVESAASRVLQGVAAEHGKLLEVMKQVGLGGLQPTTSSFEELSLPMEPSVFATVVKRLAEALPLEVLEEVGKRTGVSREPLLKAVAMQLHLVQIFALSDGDSFEENIRAVEHLVRSGNVELFAAA